MISNNKQYLISDIGEIINYNHSTTHADSLSIGGVDEYDKDHSLSIGGVNEYDKDYSLSIGGVDEYDKDHSSNTQIIRFIQNSQITSTAQDFTLFFLVCCIVLVCCF